MNPFSPILPPGSPLARPLSQRRSHVRTVFFVVAGVSVFLLMVMLIQGCIHSNRTTEIANMTKPAVVTASPIAASNSASHAPSVSTAQPVLRPSVPAVAQQPVLPLRTSERAAKDYSVVNGDTYSKIAKANSVSVSVLAKANPGVDPTKLRIGQVLHVPVVGQKQALPSSNVTHASVKDKQ
jgi:LysM repeat protein